MIELTKRAVSILFGTLVICTSLSAQLTEKANQGPIKVKNPVVEIEAANKNASIGVGGTGQPMRPAPASRLANPNLGNRKGSAVPRKDVKVEFGSVKGKPVLTMDQFGGFRVATPEGFEESPLLEIYADGKIKIGRKTTMTEEAEGQMDLVELKSLLSFIADDCRFFDWTSDALKKDMLSNSKMIIMDAPTTRISVTLDDHSNTVDVYALPQSVDQTKRSDAIASMVAIAGRCKHIIAMTKLGSEEEASIALQAVNDAVKKKLPDDGEFTLDDLQFAERFTDGRKTASFVQEKRENGRSRLVYATWQMQVDGAETVNVNVVTR